LSPRPRCRWAFGVVGLRWRSSILVFDPGLRSRDSARADASTRPLGQLANDIAPWASRAQPVTGLRPIPDRFKTDPGPIQDRSGTDPEEQEPAAAVAATGSSWGRIDSGTRGPDRGTDCGTGPIARSWGASWDRTRRKRVLRFLPRAQGPGRVQSRWHLRGGTARGSRVRRAVGSGGNDARRLQPPSRSSTACRSDQTCLRTSGV